jgi:hypothetical protein
MILPNGVVYEGEYRQGRREGAGQLRYPDGRVEAGLWREGVRVDDAAR